MIESKNLLPVIRRLVLISTGVWIVLVFAFTFMTIPPSPSRYIQLSRIFADTAGIYLFCTLLIGPLAHQWRKNPWSVVAIKARQSIGVSVFIFGVLHSSTAFLMQLGGWDGLQYLSSRYLLALALGLNALLLVLLLTITSPNGVVEFLGGKLWKVIHRMVYVAGVLVLLHMVLLGSRFANLHSLVAVCSYVAISLLWMLECARFDRWLARFVPIIQRIHPTVLIGAMCVLLVGWFMMQHPVNPYSLSSHDGHYEFQNIVGTQGGHH